MTIRAADINFQKMQSHVGTNDNCVVGQHRKSSHGGPLENGNHHQNLLRSMSVFCLPRGNAYSSIEYVLSLDKKLEGWRRFSAVQD